jgi:hypothetical protein
LDTYARQAFGNASAELAMALDEWKNAGADALTVVEALLRFIQASDVINYNDVEYAEYIEGMRQ